MRAEIRVRLLSARRHTLTPIRFAGQAVMGKLGWTAIFVIGAAVASDEYWNYGYFTDGTLEVLREIRHAFGW